MKIQYRKNSVDWKRTISLSACIIFSIFIGLEFHPLIDNNANAVNVIVTIFSILAGFLIAAITFIVEPVINKSSSWEELQLLKPVVKRKMLRHKLLFILYLMTLGCALFIFLIPDKNSASYKYLLNGLITIKSDTVNITFSDWQLIVNNSDISDFLGSIFLSLVTFVFLISFTLPSSLINSQLNRYESVLDENKPKVLKQD